jgi:pimeloyl-ACP methyl ester carboxylesterase
VAQKSAEIDGEFGLLEEAAAEAEIPYAAAAVRRSWLDVGRGCHVSAVVWGNGPAEVVLLHEAGRSARQWDEVALALRRPAVAIDLPGHGRSSWRADARYEPRKLATAVAGAIRLAAPQARLVAGSGLGGLTALALATTPRPALLPKLVLVDTLPGIGALAAREPRTGPERFGSRDEAIRFLASTYPKWREAAIRREVLYELGQTPAGVWEWRHHPGNLADPTGSQFDDPTLWGELAALAVPAWLIRSYRSARIIPDVVGQLTRRAPNVQTITVPDPGDVVADRPAELAALLNQLLAANRHTGVTLAYNGSN